MIKIFSGLLLSITLLLNISAQENPEINKANISCTYINRLIDSIRTLHNDPLCLRLGTTIEDSLKQIISKKITYTLPLDSLKKVGKIPSPDKAFRLFNWNVPLSDGSSKFFTLIQLNPGKDSVCRVIALNDQSANFTNNINTGVMSSTNWFGALYYEIVPQKINGNIVYLLLGVHFNGLFTNKKIIETMFFNEAGQPIFGTPILLVNKKMQNRIIFEYSINATMSLRYDSRLKMIIFDHLSPPSPLYNGDYKFYGPDFSFDGLKFEGGKWNYVENINFHK